MAALGNEYPLGITCEKLITMVTCYQENEKMEEKVGGRVFTVNLFTLKKLFVT